MLNDRTNILKEAAFHEVTANILPYWMNKMVDNENGGFYGSIDFNGKLDPKASKGGVLNARILWTFSRAYNVLGDAKYLEVAKRAYQYLEKYFRDPEYNGIYWELDYTGKPINKQKYCYVQGFYIYGLTEYYRATNDTTALEQADKVFHLLEKYARDKKQNGYFEAFAHDWTVTDNVRISAKDLNENKTHNTHLHILEAYTNLYNVSQKPEYKEALDNLIVLLAEKFYNPANGHFKLFFDDDWNAKGELVSYGHDIETSWLLWEAILASGSDEMKEKYEPIVLHIADVASRESFDTDGGQYYEGNPRGVVDTDKHWWPQAEAVVGFINAYDITVNEKYLDYAAKTWQFIEEYVVDKERGEWQNKLTKDRKPIESEMRAGFWKCPYHNSRVCFELITRLSK